MTDPEDIPEPDRLGDAPHPRRTARLFGQDAAEAAFLEAFTTGRLHHGWLISGPRGIGKATLAWKIARFLLAQPADDGGMFAPAPPTTLDIPNDSPTARRVASLGEPRLHLCRRAWDAKKERLTKDLGIEAMRELLSFFRLSAADGGWRVAIVDCADEMNTNSANALLKLLEEPPDQTVILLIAHQPSALLPTIRSRCRTLRCQPLSAMDQAAALDQAGVSVGAEAEALAELSQGSVGEAYRLREADGITLYADLINMIGTSPLPRDAALKLANSAVDRAAEPRYTMICDLMMRALYRLARYGAAQPAVWTEAAPHEARHFANLAPNLARARDWADLSADLQGRLAHARAVNLDPSAVILDSLLKIDQCARRQSA